MPDIIQLLPDHVANQIAAGEVVQRPASVVKELLENAIDATATNIALVLKDAGKTLIQVTDNGIGMTPADALLSFERHATSKIKIAEDLFNLHTKGFRGEALASIAAIAHVSIQTKQKDQQIGTKITVQGSKIVDQQPAVVSVGSTIAVKNLFFNIPARRNFLKSNPVETRHIIDEFHRVALAHPDIAFTMTHNDDLVFNLPSSNARQRIVNIFGSKTNEKLVPVSETTDMLKIDGFVIKPDFAKKGRGQQFFFVNDRFIKSPYLNHAVNAAFEGLIKPTLHPGYFLFLEVDPQSIDINIHPTKTEIKFDDEHALYAMIRATIKHSLGQFSIAPVLDFNRESSLDTPYNYSNKTPVSPTIDVDKDFNPFSKAAKQKNIDFPYKRDKDTAHWDALYVGLHGPNTTDGSISDETHLTFESDQVTGSLFEKQSHEASGLTFQVQNKYIISPIKSGLMVIHQHLAHQRILYEELLKNITVHQGVSQQLLFPLELTFSIPDVLALQKIQEQLERTGFVFGAFGEDTLSITGIPASLVEGQTREVLEQLLKDLMDEVPDAGFSQNDLLVRSMAKSMAVKTGASLNSKEREHLVNQLFMCKQPSVSPSNQAVIITLDANDFDKKFL